jgi:cobalt/nickel transport system permease protein
MELLSGMVYYVSPLSRLEARVKVVAIVIFTFMVVTLESKFVLGLATLSVLFLVALARLPLSYLGKRLSWMLPFAGMLIIMYPLITPGETLWCLTSRICTLTVSVEGVNKATVLFLRMINAILLMSVLSATTPFPDLMRALKRLSVPVMLVNLVEFTVRYLYILGQELQRMQLARKARCFKKGNNLLDLRTFTILGQLIGILFLRSYNRGERIYNAMLSRGFSGEVNCCGHCHLKPQDFWWGSGIVLAGLSLKLIDVGGGLWQILLR